MKIEYDNSNELVLIKDEEEYSFSKKEEYKEIFKRFVHELVPKEVSLLKFVKGIATNLQE